MSEIRCEIRAIGRLWMPACPVAWSKDYRVGTGPFQADIRSLEDAERQLSMDSGDLSSIEDYEVVFHVKRVRKVPGVVGVVLHHRTWTARPWKQGEDSELAYDDMAYPAED